MTYNEIKKIVTASGYEDTDLNLLDFLIVLIELVETLKKIERKVPKLKDSVK